MSKVDFASLRLGEGLEGAWQTTPILSGTTEGGLPCEMVATVVIDAVGSVTCGFEVATDASYTGFFDKGISLEDKLLEAKSLFWELLEDDYAGDDFLESDGDDFLESDGDEPLAVTQ
jgi:hypothetical protein